MNHFVGLTKKLVFGMTLVAIITYGISSFFIFYLSHLVDSWIPERWFNILTICLGILWSGILGFFAANYITKALRDIEKSVRQVAGGRLDVNMPDIHTHDELEELSNCLKVMVERLNETVYTIQNHTEVTTKRIKHLHQASDEVNRQVTKVEETITSISTGAHSETEMSLDVLDRIEKGLDISESIKKQATVSSQFAITTVNDLEQSAQSVNDLIEGVYKMGRTNEHMMTVSNQLQVHMKEINSIVETVSEFAEKTHILAINANIEAARAGDAGKGFIVVADEVQNLANQSTDAANQIHKRIKNIQVTFDQALAKQHEQLQMGKEEIKRANQTNEQIKTMKHSVYQVRESIENILQNADIQHGFLSNIVYDAKKTFEISKQTSDMVKGLKQSAATQTQYVSHIIESIEDISKGIDSLNNQVNVLKVKSVR
ncbi:methyl-accepting chemotaxis protein [Terrilactibacillus laevilacticus]|uniref:methyl-accepting chemotaxis protein n=1 Tax=Terrilactibacillus laevilacticus TaxID=1380157 RepID=UPI001147A465|nr:methyl-accepting chemotaxis protein [Terrilactibacillus laevilacticus]